MSKHFSDSTPEACSTMPALRVLSSAVSLNSSAHQCACKCLRFKSIGISPENPRWLPKQLLKVITVLGFTLGHFHKLFVESYLVSFRLCWCLFIYLFNHLFLLCLTIQFSCRLTHSLEWSQLLLCCYIAAFILCDYYPFYRWKHR